MVRKEAGKREVEDGVKTERWGTMKDGAGDVCYYHTWVFFWDTELLQQYPKTTVNKDTKNGLFKIIYNNLLGL